MARSENHRQKLLYLLKMFYEKTIILILLDLWSNARTVSARNFQSCGEIKSNRRLEFYALLTTIVYVKGF